MQIEPWQIPVLGMALLTLPPSVHFLVQKARGRNPKEKEGRQWLRTVLFAIATVVLTVVFVVALGPELADVVTSVAAAVAGLIAAAVAVYAGKQTVEANRSKSRHTRGDG